MTPTGVPADADPLLFTPQQASQRLGGKPSAAWLARHAGAYQIDHVRIGRTVRFTAAHLEKLIADSSWSAQGAGRPVPSFPRGARRRV